MLPLLLFACSPAAPVASPVDSGVVSADTSVADDAGPLHFDGEPPTNVLMLTLDTTRRDLFARHGGGDYTPALDALSEQSVVLNDLRSCSNWTYDAVLCVQSATTSIELGFVSYFTEDDLPSVPAEVSLASALLSERGYQTALVTGNWITTDALDLNRGFDVTVPAMDARAEAITSEGLALYDSFDPTQPWYLHLHYVDPHAPYSPHQDYREALESLPDPPFDLESTDGLAQLTQRYDSLSPEDRAIALQWLDALYGGEVRHLDDQIGALLEALEDQGALEDTLVVIWTDHGEQFFEHGSRGHGLSLFDEENAAAGLLWSPRLRSMRWDAPVTLEDLWPTILAALEQDPLPHAYTGLPLGQRRDDDPRFAHKATESRVDQSVVMNGWKLIYDWNGSFLAFDLNEDPTERDPITDPNDPEVRALWSALEPQVEALEALYTLGEPVDPGI